MFSLHVQKPFADCASSRFPIIFLWIDRIVALPSPAAETFTEDEEEEEDEEQRRQQQQQEDEGDEEEEQTERRPAARTAAFPADLLSPRVGTAGDGFQKKVHALHTHYCAALSYMRCVLCVVYCDFLRCSAAAGGQACMTLVLLVQ